LFIPNLIAHGIATRLRVPRWRLAVAARQQDPRDAAGTLGSDLICFLRFVPTLGLLHNTHFIPTSACF
jgi:hypothetical protein